MIKGKKLVVIVLVLSMVITGVYQPSGGVAEAAIGSEIGSLYAKKWNSS